MRNGNLTLRALMVNVLLLGSVMTGMLIFSGSVFDTYDADMDEEQSGLMEQASDIASEVDQNMIDAKDQAEQIGGGIAAGLFILKSVWNVVRTTVEALPIIGSFLSFASVSLGIPTWFIDLVIGIVTIGLVYEMVSLYRGLRT